MGNRGSATLVLLATLVAWTALGATLLWTDPTASRAAAFVCAAAFFAAVSGSATMIGLLARRRTSEHPEVIGISIRQGCIVGVAVTVAIVLQSRRLLTWINLLLLIGVLTVFELFLVSLRGGAPRASSS